MRSGYKELGLELVEPLQDQPHKSQQPPMVDEEKDEGAGDPIKILLKEALKQQRNSMMDNFSSSLSRYPRVMHRIPTTTLEMLHSLRYKLVLKSPYSRVR